MTLDINFGPGYWRFKLVKTSYVAPDDVSVTFQVNMADVEEVKVLMAFTLLVVHLVKTVT